MRAAASVGISREVHFHEAQPVKMRQQFAGIVARLDPYGGRVGLLGKGVDGHGRIGHRFIAPETQVLLNHRLPP